MTAWSPYIASAQVFEKLDEKHGKRFYPVQKGGGPSVKLVSPTQQTVEMAKMDIKRQIQEAGNVGPGINSSVKRKRPQSTTRRRTVKKAAKKKSPTKKKKAPRKNAKKIKVCKVTKRRKFARK